MNKSLDLPVNFNKLMVSDTLGDILFNRSLT